MICDTCTDLNAKLLFSSMTGPTRKMYQDAKDLHIRVREDRCMNGMHVMKGKHFPKYVMNWVIDGSDAIVEESQVQGVWSDCAWSLGIFAYLQLCLAWTN